MNKIKTPPFPQANNLELIYTLLMSLTDDGLVYSSVAKDYQITMRQGSYYLDALRFLDLAFKVGNRYFLTDTGKQIKNYTSKIEFCKYLKEHTKLSSLYENFQEKSNKKEQIRYISSYIQTNYSLTIGTSRRRASTIYNWFIWINNNLRDNNNEL